MMLSLDEAAALNILDPVQGVYTDLKSKSKMLIGDAVDQKLVEIEYDNSATGMCSVEKIYPAICCLSVCLGRVTPKLDENSYKNINSVPACYTNERIKLGWSI